MTEYSKLGYRIREIGVRRNNHDNRTVRIFKITNTIFSKRAVTCLMTFISKSPEGLMFCFAEIFGFPMDPSLQKKKNIAISGIMDRDNASSLAGRLKKALRIL